MRLPILLLPLLGLFVPASGLAAGFPITRYGAAPDDHTADTAAIQKAIDACSKAGGGTVIIPKGRFVSGGITLTGNLRLQLAEGAILQGSKRTNMLAAFTHFAPKDRHPKLPSDQWVVRDIVIENADALYLYNNERGLWQQGMPAGKLLFQNVTATGLTKPVRCLGDAGRRLELSLQDVSLALHPDHADKELINIRNFGSLDLSDVTLKNNGSRSVLIARDGNSIRHRNLTAVPKNIDPLSIQDVDTIR